MYLNACKKVTGIFLIASIIDFEAPIYCTNDIINWFTASLRKGKNKVCHYLDDVKGGGSYLENKSRVYFFKIIKKVLKLL